MNLNALARATPGYVGADLASLTSTAGIVAVKRIFKQLTSTLPSEPLIDMQVDPPPHSTIPPNLPLTGSISHFLSSHPAPLSEDQLAPLCITFDDFLSAIKQVQPSSKREGFATVPDVTWADIGALQSIRVELNMAIVQPIQQPELFMSIGIEAPCGVLLWGPPGCGKTLLAKAVANESRANFISVKGPELLNKVCNTWAYAHFLMLPDSMLVKVSELSDKYSLEHGRRRHV